MGHLAVAALVLVCSLIGVLPNAGAQEPPPLKDDIPRQLRPWVGWVLYDDPAASCPWSNGVRSCEWPGDLRVVVAPDGAQFTLRVYVDRDMTVQLPGGPQLWPQSVQSESGPVTIVSSSSQLPYARLSKGAHTIRGEFEWRETPEVIDVPPLVGRTQVTVSGKAIPFPRVREGKLYLGDAASDEGEADSLRVSVYRRFEDGVPLRVTTRLELSVAGKAREVDLGKIQLAKSVPVAITSELPVRAPRDGAVHVYIRPGTHFVDIESVIPETINEVKVPSVDKQYYEPQEVWIWRPNEKVRAVQIGGLSGVDPERTTLPQDWRGDTTFLAEPGKTLTITETRRGMPERAPNMVNLSREIWLDLDGKGYTVRDQITGQMNQGWRLNHGPGATLGRASQDGHDLFITNDPSNEMSGVEIRSRALNLKAELRLDSAVTDIGIVGWDHDVQSLDATLRLPPGWTLIGGKGVDRMPGTWLDSWTLWDFFFVLMVALAIGKLFGWGWVPVVTIALCLAHENGDAPEILWIQLIVTLALLRVVPQGIWRKLIVVYRWGAVATLIIVLSMYARQQIREALHPQVGDSNIAFQDHSVMDMALESMVENERALLIEGDVNVDRGAKPRKKSRSKKAQSSGDRWGGDLDLSNYGNLQQIDPNSVVQTGPGLPTWSWTEWHLGWSGPVRKDHRITLFLIPPNINMMITFVRVALLILLAFLLLAPAEMYWNRRAKTYSLWTKVFGQAGALIVSIGFSVAIANDARAEEPQVQEFSNVNDNVNLGALGAVDSDILSTLRRRLVESTVCEVCVVASRADIRLRKTAWTMTAEVHVEKLSGWGIPGTADSLAIDSIMVDGVATSQIRRSAQGLAVVRLTPGRHIVTVQGNVPNRNVVTIQLDPKHRPRLVTFESDGWTVDGISPSGVPDASLQLTRKAQADSQTSQELVSELPPWFLVERTFQLGLPWQIHTRVTRQDLSRPQLAKLPILEGEKVISANTRVKDGQALVDFDRGVGVVEYVSEIPIRDLLELKAALNQPWSETWVVECSRIWRCDFEGIPAVQDVTEGLLSPRWQPWPGESVSIHVKRPEGTPGQALTVESVKYTMTPGRRLMQATLEMTVRASQGTRQNVKLPPSAELQKVAIDNIEKPIRPTDGVVSLPVEPRTQTFRLTWQQPWQRDTVERLPQIDIGSSAVNTTLNINLGEERWLVWAQGPSWGPAILFWSHLAFLMILGLLLGLIKGLPIRWWEWLLLVIGLSQIEIVLASPIVLWFIVLAWRKRSPPEAWERFDLLQLFIVGLSLLALGSLIGAIHTNLMVDIDMQVQGAMSTNTALRWYVDQTSGPLPSASIVSVPILVWRITMLVWAFWLVWRLLSWVQWGWLSFSSGGFWKNPPKRKKPAAPAPVEVPVSEPEPDREVDAPADASKASASRPVSASRPQVVTEKTTPAVTAKPQKQTAGHRGKLPAPSVGRAAKPKEEGDVSETAADTPLKKTVQEPNRRGQDTEPVRRRKTASGKKQKPGRRGHSTEPGTPREREETQVGVPQVTRPAPATKPEETPTLFPPPEDEDSEATDSND